jgi:hypothetical protein
MRSGGVPHAAAWLGALLLAWPAGPAQSGDHGEIGPGAYCPLPAPGEERKCLAPARAAYGEFFTAVEGGAGAPDLHAAEANVETAVAGGADDEEAAYLALSSLSYGYYQLAQRAAHSPDSDPDITRRLERWNALLSRAYRDSPDDERYRAAVKEAALDLRARAAIDLPCQGEQDGRACRSTEDVLRDIDAASERVGIRGALAGLLRRVFGGGEP